MFLDLWQPDSNFCLPVFRFRGVCVFMSFSSLCVSVQISSSYKDPSHGGLGAHPLWYSLD